MPTRTYDIPPLPPRPSDGHKGTFGRVLVVAGHPDMLGAPVLAGTAAYRVGAGYVQVAMPPDLLPAGLAVTPELVGHRLASGSDAKLLAAGRLADALVLGCGMGTRPASRRRLLSLLKLGKPCVLDADALNLLAAERKLPPLPEVTVLTPHPGEMARLARMLRIETPVSATAPLRVKLALAAARAAGRVVVLKGAFTVVADPDARFYVEPSANTALAKAGTGDVLAGILGALLAQAVPAFEAALLAVHIHARAAQHARQRLGERSPLARDIIAGIAPALLELESGRLP